MLKKKKISDTPLTYQLFEKLPTIEPFLLGVVYEIRPELWHWESTFGGSAGEGPLEYGINRVIFCAQRSDYVKKIKKRGMQS